uniref:Secreted protein n=1 Tax=Haemonchus contortus TaxID=6289 RepID=A0A7I5E6I9_HAECO
MLFPASAALSITAALLSFRSSFIASLTSTGNTWSAIYSPIRHLETSHVASSLTGWDPSTRARKTKTALAFAPHTGNRLTKHRFHDLGQLRASRLRQMFGYWRRCRRRRAAQHSVRTIITNIPK